MSRSKYKQRSNRNARILMSVFSIFVVLSFILGLLGPTTFRNSQEPTPVPTRVFPTVAPLDSLTPPATVTPTAGVPTPVMVTPTASP